VNKCSPNKFIEFSKAEYDKQYYEDYKAKILEINKEYRENNKEYYAQYLKEYYEDNKTKLLEQKNTLFALWLHIYKIK